MEITVCICTHDRPHYLRDCLDGLRRQTVPGDRFAILIVDSASTGTVPDTLVVLARAYGARLIRLEQPGISAARNAGLHAARTPYVAFIDDDAIPAPDWLACILRALVDTDPPPAVLGGRILPHWEQPLPAWWPPSLRGVLSIIEHEGQGEYRTSALPPGLEPYAANMVVHVASALAVGGFGQAIGRYGNALLSDEEVQLAWTLQNAGHAIRYDSRIVVRHQIQANRLNVPWLLSRLYWQGASTVLTRRLTGRPWSVWREAPRRLAVLLLFAPAALCPAGATRLIGLRWRLAYAAGFLRAACGWRAARTAARKATQVAGIRDRPRFSVLRSFFASAGWHYDKCRPGADLTALHGGPGAPRTPTRWAERRPLGAVSEFRRRPDP
jgi:glucosyl-dolichyl phosphate glucuronosyltransferase